MNLMLETQSSLDYFKTIIRDEYFFYVKRILRKRKRFQKRKEKRIRKKKERSTDTEWWCISVFR